MADLFEKIISEMIMKYMTQIEVSFVAQVVSFDKSAMTAEIAPLLKADTPGAVDQTHVVANIKDVRIERSPGIRPIYAAGDLVKVVLSASPLDEAIENSRPVNILGHKFSLSFCTITGKVKPKKFTAPSHYSNDGLILGDDPNFYINFKSDQVFIKGKTVIDGVEEVKGNTRSLVTHAELNTGLSNFAGTPLTGLQGELVKIAAAINAIVPGSYVPSPPTFDISSAKTDNIKTGAG